MKIAVIVPTPHLDLIADRDYQMCLAHLVADDRVYRKFYRDQAEQGHFVLMDNGVVETGHPMEIDRLLRLAMEVRATELVLPDTIRDAKQSIADAIDSLLHIHSRGLHKILRVMAVPHGRDLADWDWCLSKMLSLPVEAIGISKFTLGLCATDADSQSEHRRWASTRVDVLNTPSGKRLRDTEISIHLLGCGETPAETAKVDEAFPGRIRGTDSGVAAMAAQMSTRLRDCVVRPEGALDFNAHLDSGLLRDNIDDYLTWSLPRSTEGGTK